MSGDPSQEYFSDGISEEILNSLVRVKGLEVAGRNSGFSFKGKNEDIRTIGEKLNVELVLEGSVRKFGNQVRITAQLVNVADGFHVWSETYDREMENIFEIQQEIAEMISTKLKMQIQSTRHEYEPNLEAYDLVLKAKDFLSQDYEGTEKGMACLQTAVKLDPNYARAYALMSEAYANYAAYSIMPAAEAFSKSRKAAEKALSLDENEFHARKILAYVNLHFDFNWDKALDEYQLAIESGLPDPDQFIIHYDIFLHQNYDHAIETSKAILKRDPLGIQPNWHLGFCYYYAGQYELAIQSFDDALELKSDYSEGHRWKGVSLANMGKFEEAITSLEKALSITNGKGPAQIELLAVKIMSGHKNEVIPILNHLINTNNVDPMGPAILFTLLQENEKAITWLEKGYQQRSLLMITLKTLKIWDPLRENPRFQAVYKKMNFPEENSVTKY